MKRLTLIVVLLPFWQGVARGADWKEQIQLLIKTPDASISGTYNVPASADLVNRMFNVPMLMARLWEGYEFTPRYQISMRGEAIHVEDPTGISGDLYLAEQAPNRRAYFAAGALNHALVPAFQGKMALVVTMTPKGSGVSTRIDLYIRTDSRILGLLARTLFPLVRTRAEHRMTANMTDIGTIMKDVSTAPQQAASRLKSKADAAALIKILPGSAKTVDGARPPIKAPLTGR